MVALRTRAIMITLLLGTGRLNCYLLNQFIIEIFDAFVTIQVFFNLWAQSRTTPTSGPPPK